MEGQTASPRCAACGDASPPGMRFCTRCGAPLTSVGEPPAVAGPAEPPTAPFAGTERPAAAAHRPAPRWRLDTPPANESWWRNPIVIAIAVVTALGGGGVASWQFFIRSSSTVSALHALPQAKAQAAPTTTAAAPVPGAPSADETAFVGSIVDILRQSHAGIHAARGAHDYGAALGNRRRLVAALDRLDPTGQAESLTTAYATLREALAASARADAAHIACGCDDTLAEDVTATRLKRRFARQFDAYARRYAGHPVDPDLI